MDGTSKLGNNFELYSTVIWKRCICHFFRFAHLRFHVAKQWTIPFHPSTKLLTAGLIYFGQREQGCLEGFLYNSQLRPEARNRRGETRPRETASQTPLGAPQKALRASGGRCSGASERCVRFQRSGERRWATQRPLRGPVFPDAPWGLRGFQPSGSYPQATDKIIVKPPSPTLQFHVKCQLWW